MTEPVQQATGALAPRGRMRVLLGLVGASVGLQLINAALVKLAAATPSPPQLVIAGLLLVVLALSFARFVIWNGIHKRYPISLAYPLSALFFPAVVVLAWAMGEAVGLAQIAGTLLVMAGVIRVISPQSHRDNEPHFPVSD